MSDDHVRLIVGRVAMNRKRGSCRRRRVVPKAAHSFEKKGTVVLPPNVCFNPGAQDGGGGGHLLDANPGKTYPRNGIVILAM